MGDSPYLLSEQHISHQDAPSYATVMTYFVQVLRLVIDSIVRKKFSLGELFVAWSSVLKITLTKYTSSNDFKDAPPKDRAHPHTINDYSGFTTAPLGLLNSKVREHVRVHLARGRRLQLTQ